MPDKVIHEIRLNQYSAVPADRTRRFSLGTKDSYGIEQLRIVPGEGWDGLTITATFHPPEGEAVQVLVPADGLIDVPPEATRSGSELPTKYGKIVFAGVADGVQRISCNLPYTVMDHAPVDGAASSGPSPSWYEQAAAHFVPSGGKAGQVLAKASDADLDVEWADGGNGTADHAKLSNRDAADQHPISAITGLQKELDGKQPAGNYLTADSLQAATDAALAQAKASGEFDGADGHPGENGSDGYSPTANVTQNENGATITVTDKNGTTTATVTNGKDGADGNPGADGKDGITPTIGENGNWYLGETDTGKPSRGADGATGATGATGQKGTDGKSAYQYAVEGGYTGTETEFVAKLAQEMPTALPNPNKLILSGAVTAEYDGSEEVGIEIPTGGDSYTLPVASANTLGGVKPISATSDMTQDVGVTGDGKLKTATASAAQINSAVNEFLTNNPVSSGAGTYKLVVDETITEGVTSAAFNLGGEYSDILTVVDSIVQTKEKNTNGFLYFNYGKNQMNAVVKYGVGKTVRVAMQALLSDNVSIGYYKAPEQYPFYTSSVANCVIGDGNPKTSTVKIFTQYNALITFNVKIYVR